jgi:hypothetical protein
MQLTLLLLQPLLNPMLRLLLMFVDYDETMNPRGAAARKGFLLHDVDMLSLHAFHHTPFRPYNTCMNVHRHTIRLSNMSL